MRKSKRLSKTLKKASHLDLLRMSKECCGTKEESVYSMSGNQEAHDSAYSIHPGGNKMYQDLKVSY
jgi:hypothetical protein